jgi:hypothetical protein
MTDTSKILTQFLASNIIPNIKTGFQKTRFSERSKEFLGRLFEQIHSSHESLPKITPTPSSEITYGNNFDWCPSEIKSHIENMKKIKYECSQEIHGRDITIHLLCSPSMAQKQVVDVFVRAFTWLSVAFQYSPRKCSKHINIHLYFTDLKKVLPKHGEPIKEIHANTAFTTFCKPSTEIHLFREEEWFKVLIHESFHSLGLDFSEFDHTDTNKQVLSIFPVKSDVRIFETYCETWAETLNVMFIVVDSAKGDFNSTKLIKKTEQLLDQERIFSAFQCVKVLNFYGLDYSDLYERTTQAHINRLHRYKENTHVLSYYIIKSIFMFYINDFVEWCLDHNSNGLNFDKTPSKLKKNMEEYCGFIRDHYTNKEYIGVLKNIDNWYDSVNPHNMKSMELQTLRMTSLDI